MVLFSVDYMLAGTYETWFSWYKWHVDSVLSEVTLKNNAHMLMPTQKEKPVVLEYFKLISKIV
jgi:hypothetical protein